MVLKIQWGWVAVIVSVGACSQEVPAPRAEAQPVAVGREDGSGGGPGPVSFTVEPAVVRTCEAKDRAVSASVRWRIERGDSAGVAIYVVGRDDDRKLWLKGGASGESTTGRWVFPGTRFQLVDAASGRQLAESQVSGGACE